MNTTPQTPPPDSLGSPSRSRSLPSELERVQNLFDFLQGEVPQGCRYKKTHQPKLTANQAWTVIWWLGNEYWKVPDYIERCDVCGSLYDSESEGDCLDFGKAPYHFCDSCMCAEKYGRKVRSKLNPENASRKSSMEPIEENGKSPDAGEKGKA